MNTDRSELWKKRLVANLAIAEAEREARSHVSSRGEWTSGTTQPLSYTVICTEPVTDTQARQVYGWVRAHSEARYGAVHVVWSAKADCWRIVRLDDDERLALGWVDIVHPTTVGGFDAADEAAATWAAQADVELAAEDLGQTTAGDGLWEGRLSRRQVADERWIAWRVARSQNRRLPHPEAPVKVTYTKVTSLPVADREQMLAD